MAVHSFRDALRRQVTSLRQLRQRRDLSVKTRPPSTTKPARTEDQIPTPNNVPTLPFWQRLGPLTRAAEAYARAQRKRPYTTQLCSSLVIYLCSDCEFAHTRGLECEEEPSRVMIASQKLTRMCSVGTVNGPSGL
jgi:dihydroorotate dehydrogenase